MADVVYINEAEGTKRVMNNGKLYAKLLTKFKSDTNMSALLTSADSQDWEKAQNAAHALKGLAANLSLEELFNKSLDIETQIKGKSVKSDSIESLKACYAETLIQMDKVIAEYA